MPAVQMNVRIDSQLKERGDQVFERLGYTPSQVVRAVWSYAAENGHAPAIVERMLGADPIETDSIERDLHRMELDQGRALVDDFCRVHAIPTSALPETIDYDASREEAYLERLSARGLS